MQQLDCQRRGQRALGGRARRLAGRKGKAGAQPLAPRHQQMAHGLVEHLRRAICRRLRGQVRIKARSAVAQVIQGVH